VALCFWGILGELLRDTVLLGRDDVLRGLLVLLVLRAGRRRGGHLTPLECQMKAVAHHALAPQIRRCR
jgi:hypothetical protein